MYAGTENSSVLPSWEEEVICTSQIESVIKFWKKMMLPEDTNPLPVIVTVVPIGPEAGFIESIAGV
jgi:hypothetical protein